MNAIFKKLRKFNWANYKLYIFCNFIAVLLITSYSALMYSPTVLTVLPKGGDSRKQAFAIFALVCIGCITFAIYSTALFYRTKTRDFGVMLALGASRKQLKSSLMKEVMVLGAMASIVGMVLGIPFTWGLWQLFRLVVVDTVEMKLTFNFVSLIIPVILMLVIMTFAYLLAIPFFKKMNIIDVMNSAHKNEMVHEVKRWCGIVGLLLVVIGGPFAFLLPNWYMDHFQAYPPAWLNLFYIPVFIGVYMILLHVVVHGVGRRGKNRYKGLVATSMMKFQGKQTVNNMLVITLLIAGACFGAFYVPTMMASLDVSTQERTYDYVFRNPEQIESFSKEEVEKLADKYGITIDRFNQLTAQIVGMDGERQVENGRKFHYVYEKLCCSGRVISESDYETLTGQQITTQPGYYYGVANKEESGTYWFNNDATLLTNMATRKQIPVTFGGYVHFEDLVGVQCFYVLNDTDYDKLIQGNTDDWSETVTCFTTGQDTYKFANEMYHNFVNRFSNEDLIGSYYDRVASIAARERSEVYFGDDKDSGFPELEKEKCDQPEFQREWGHMPQIKTLDKANFFKTYAVFLMMFIFIVIVCMAAALVIAYTRCITIAINNRYVFEDLQKLGASNRYLTKEIKRQSSKIYVVPSVIGMAIMYALFTFILLMNEGNARLTSTEVKGLGYCACTVIGLATLVFINYRIAIRNMRRLVLGKLE